MIPVGHQAFGGVGCAPQRVVVGGPLARGDRSISPRMAIIASQKASSSAGFSLSVGSTISVPATRKLIVGAWKP